jgi:hypothetical protein
MKASDPVDDNKFIPCPHPEYHPHFAPLSSMHKCKCIVIDSPLPSRWLTKELALSRVGGVSSSPQHLLSFPGVKTDDEFLLSFAQ